MNNIECVRCGATTDHHDFLACRCSEKQELLDVRETATVLAALRHFQLNVPEEDAREAFPEHFYTVSPLDYDEIDELCEKLCSS